MVSVGTIAGLILIAILIGYINKKGEKDKE